MKTARWILLGLVVLVAAVAATLYAILQSLDTGELRGLIEAQAERATGRKLRLEGPIDLSISLNPAVVLRKVTFDNADWGSRPELLDVGTVEAQIALLPLLEGRYVIERVVVSDADILLESNKQGEVNWALPAQDAAASGDGEGAAGETPSGSPVIPEIGAVVVRDSRLVYRDGVSGESLLLTLDTLELTPDGRLVRLEAEGSYQEVPFELAGRVGGLPILLAGGDLPVELSGTLAGAAIAAEGRIVAIESAATPDIRLEIAAESLSQFDKLAGIPLPALGPLAFSGRIGLDAGLLTLDGMALSLGESDLSGTLTASLEGPRPAIQAELTGAKLDLSDLADAADRDTPVSTAPADRAASEAAGEATEPAARGDGGDGAGARYVIPDTPLPLAALQAVDAEVRLKLGQLVVDDETTLSDLELALRLERGRLDVSRLRAGAFEGELEGTLSLDAAGSPPPFALHAQVRGLSAGRLLAAYAGSQDLQVPLDMTLDLEGQGASPRTIAASLDGSSEILGGEGVITNRLLAIVASGLDEILGPLFGEREQTRLNCLVSRFRFEDGVAHSQAQLLDSSTFSLAGGGTVDLGEERLDLKFDTRTREAALVSLAVPFVVTGRFADPQVAPDPLGAAMKAAEFVQGDSNPLAALGRMVAGDPPAAGQANGCVAALEQSAGVPASETPVGEAREELERLLDGEDPMKALEDAARDALGGGDSDGAPDPEALREGIEGLFRRD